MKVLLFGPTRSDLIISLESLSCVLCGYRALCVISQGDGIEFKKIFRKIKEQCKDIICKPPPMQGTD
jgi:hypothetical protein